MNRHCAITPSRRLERASVSIARPRKRLRFAQNAKLTLIVGDLFWGNASCIVLLEILDSAPCRTVCSSTVLSAAHFTWHRDLYIFHNPLSTFRLSCFPNAESNVSSRLSPTLMLSRSDCTCPKDVNTISWSYPINQIYVILNKPESHSRSHSC